LLGINRPAFCEIVTLDLSIKSCLTFFERHRLKLSSNGFQEFSPCASEDELQVWRLIPVDLNIRRTRPPLEVLHQQDPRVWSLSPLWSIPPLLPPLSPSSRGTQTKPPTKVTRGIQHLPEYVDKWTNTEKTSQGSSENSENSYTPPGTPPSYTPTGSPPFKLTKTTPRLYWRKRI